MKPHTKPMFETTTQVSISHLAIIFSADIAKGDGAQGNLVGQLGNELSHASLKILWIPIGDEPVG